MKDMKKMEMMKNRKQGWLSRDGIPNYSSRHALIKYTVPRIINY